MQLVRDLGMEDELIAANSLMGFMREGTLHHLRADKLALDAARTKLMSFRSNLKVAKLVQDTFRLRKLLSYEDLSVAASTTSRRRPSTAGAAASTASCTTT